MKNYGVEYSQQSNIVSERTRNTNIEKLGVPYPMMSNKIKEKSKQTNLKKLGTEYDFQSESVKNKIKQSCIKKYGVENPSQSEEIKKKKIETTLKNYGVEYSLQSENIREKSKQTSLKKYGCLYPSQNKDIKEKTINTTIKKYGEIWKNNKPNYNIESIVYLDLISEKLNLPIQHALNGGEKKIIRYWVDGYIDLYKICIEWDEDRHKYNQNNDTLREKFIFEQGFKIIRINEKEFINDIEKGIFNIIEKINSYIT